ncbi:MAG: chaperone modulator CbpM [Candidatus Binatia bacterium]
MKYLRVQEVRELYGIGEVELEWLAREGFIEIKRTLEEEPVISGEDAENARLATFLMNELEVNLPGAEVIVRMRSEMIAMQRQFGKILEVLIEEIRQAAANLPRD